MKRSDKDQSEDIHYVPLEGHHEFPSSHGDCGDVDGVEWTEETIDTLREIGAILENAVRRMEKEGIEIPRSMYEKNQRRKDN